MKVAVTCDSLIQRTRVTSILEMLLGLYKDTGVELYTLVHREGAILGPVEQHRIHSTFLSNMVKDEESFWKNSYLFPSAAKNLPVSCAFDLIINISNGFSQGIKKCEQSKQITYIVDDDYAAREKKYLREKMAAPYLKRWQKKSLNYADEVWVANPVLLNHLKEQGLEASLLSPFIEMSDYPLFPEGQRKSFPNDFYLIDARSCSLDQAVELTSLLQSRKQKFKFFGLDQHLNALKKDWGNSHFIGDRCTGESAPLMAACLAMISFENKKFPVRVIETLAVGRPALIVGDNPFAEQIRGEGFFESDLCSSSLSSSLTEIEEKGKDFPAEKLRARVQQFHDAKFKGEVLRRIGRLFKS
jgi:hypothetical protein